MEQKQLCVFDMLSDNNEDIATKENAYSQPDTPNKNREIARETMLN